MADNTGIFSQFALHFSTLEEMEAYKRKVAEEKLGWKAEKNLQDMCRDSWNWQSRNPMGYGD